MSAALPVEFDPFQLARLGRRLVGDLDLAQFARFVAATAGSGGGLAVEIAFARDAAGQAVADAHLVTRVRLVCQRCLEEFDADIEAQVGFVFVTPGEPAGPEREVIELEPGGRLRWADLFEDELLLQLPMVARHPEIDDCNAQMLYKAAPGADFDAGAEPSNPFSVLKGSK